MLLVYHFNTLLKFFAACTKWVAAAYLGQSSTSRFGGKALHSLDPKVLSFPKTQPLKIDRDRDDHERIPYINICAREDSRMAANSAVYWSGSGGTVGLGNVTLHRIPALASLTSK